MVYRHVRFMGPVMQYHFNIPIKPLPWKRPGKNRWGGRYNASGRYQKALGYGILVGMNQAGLRMINGPLKLNVAFMGCRSTADVDNLLKNFCDAANGVLWEDDRQVVDKRGQKFPDMRDGISVFVELT